MFYILRTDILKKYSAFENIKYWLCDDLALATYLLSKVGEESVTLGPP